MGKHQTKPAKKLKARIEKYDSANSNIKHALTKPGSLKK